MSVVPLIVGPTVPCPPYWYPSPGVSEASSTASVGSARRHAATFAVPAPHPTEVANAAPMPLACCSSGTDDLQSCGSRSYEPPGRTPGTPNSVLYSPLSSIAPWNSPRAVGEAIWSHTLEAPPDSPKIVTRCGFPPNAAMFCCTQRIANC